MAPAMCMWPVHMVRTLAICICSVAVQLRFIKLIFARAYSAGTFLGTACLALQRPSKQVRNDENCRLFLSRMAVRARY